MVRYNVMRDTWEDGIESLRGQLDQTVKQCIRVAHRAEEIWDDACYQGERAARQARGVVQRRPFGVLGLSVLVGAAVVALLGRRDE